jgi:hypothetical protein
MGAITTSALSRLTADQRQQLHSLAASFRMERMDLSDAELEILAQLALKEITREQCLDQMRALGHTA